MSGDRERLRLKTVPEVADLFGVSRQRVQGFQREAWWRDELRTAEGWDVVGIAKAQAVAECERKLGRERTTTTTAEEKLIHEWGMTEAAEAAAIRTLDRRAKERKDLQADQSLVGVDVVRLMMNDCLGQLRRHLDDLAYKFQQHVPQFVRCADCGVEFDAGFRQLVYVPGSWVEVDDESAEVVEPAALHLMVHEVVRSFEQLLDLLSSDLFDDVGGE